jgi:hypothetical protein
MRSNPQQVFYLQGEHERTFDTNAYGIEKEINIRSYGFTAETSLQNNALKMAISSFFKTLPQALYLQIPSFGVIDLVALSATGAQLHQREGDTSYFPFLLTMHHEKPFRTHHLGKPTPFVVLPLAIKAVIQAPLDDGPIRLQMRLTDDFSCITWSLRSSHAAHNRADHTKETSFLILKLDPYNDSSSLIEHTITTTFTRETFSTYEYKLFTGKQVFLEQSLPFEEQEEQEEEESFDEEWSLSPDDVALSDIKIDDFFDENEKAEAAESETFDTITSDLETEYDNAKRD